MQAATRDEHDLIARRQIPAEDRSAPLRHQADRAAGQLDVVGLHQTRQRGGLAAAPRRAGVGTRLAPPGQKRLVPVTAGVPVRRTRREVGVDDQRQCPDADQVVDDGRHRVVGHVRKPVHTEVLRDLARDDRLRPESLYDERELPPAGFEHERGLTPRLVERQPAGRAQQLRGREGLGQSAALAGIQRLVVDAG